MASTVVCDMRLVMATILWLNSAPVKPFRPVAPLRPIRTHGPVVLASRISAHPATGPLPPRSEPFPSWLCFADLQYVGGLGELTGVPGGWKVPAHPKLDLATAGVVERPGTSLAAQRSRRCRSPVRCREMAGGRQP
jgi:hypothetical protein